MNYFNGVKISGIILITYAPNVLHKPPDLAIFFFGLSIDHF